LTWKHIYIGSMLFALFINAGCSDGIPFIGDNGNEESEDAQSVTAIGDFDRDDIKDLSCEELTSEFTRLYSQVDASSQTCTQVSDCVLVYDYPNNGANPGCGQDSTKALNTTNAVDLRLLYGALFNKSCPPLRDTIDCNSPVLKCVNSLCTVER
jgi:hypothetical protein